MDKPLDTPLTIGGHTFTSRLILGTGKYRTFQEMEQALAASGTQMVTVAIRRVDFEAADHLMKHLDRDRYVLLPNTAGCYTADDAIRTAMLGRELGLSDLVKLEVLGCRRTLLPDPTETLKAAQVLVKEGFTVMCYTSDDPVVAERLQDLGVASVMPAGAPIGSGQGILNPNNIQIILEQAQVPIIVDAGVGTASDVAVAMELGCDGVLLNTAVACATDPVRMAHAVRHGCLAGRLAWLAGRIDRRRYANASSPTGGLVTSS